MLCVDGATGKLVATRFFNPLAEHARDGDGSEKNPPRPYQLSPVRDPSMRSIHGGWLYNGVACLGARDVVVLSRGDGAPVV
jgi:hypothetical protein